MDATYGIKRDLALRSFLAHPEQAFRVSRRAHGFAAMRLLVAVADALQMIVASVIAAALFLPGQSLDSAGIGVIGAGLALVIRRGMRPTTSFQRVTIKAAAYRAVFAVVVACSMTLVIVVLIGGVAHAVRFGPWIASWGALSAIMCYAGRLMPVPVLRRVIQRAIQPTVAVVGDPSTTQDMADMLYRLGTHQVTDQLDPENPHEMRRLEQLAGQGMIDKVVIVGAAEVLLDRICLALADTPTLVCLGLTTPTSSLTAESLGGAQHPPFVSLVPSPMSDWRGVLKRLLDVAAVTVSLPLLAPLLVLVALAIRLESRGPILFRQWRFGLGSKPTQIIKFRTMYHDRGDSTGEARTIARDPRVTRVGRLLRRTSIDELPQLFNVLCGEMSLVGPRPHATHMKVDGDYYFEAVQSYRFRHRVKPGITGWAQITGSRGEVDTMGKALERVEKDLWYVQNWSLTLDLKILVKTVLGRFASPGAD